MVAEILCVGTELLLGEVVNTNSAYIAKGLAANGISVFHHQVVGDNPKRLAQSVKEAFSRSDILILTGGLGPTFDDLTKETIAEYFGLEMEMHQPSLKRLEEFFAHYNKQMTENNKKQAMMPKGAVVFENENGTAPGLAVTGGGKTAVLMPGPPREMMPMFDNQVLPYLAQDSELVFVSKNVHVFGLGESYVEDRLKDYMLSCTNPTIAPYAKTGEMYLRVTASADTKEHAEALLSPVIEHLYSEIGDHIYGVDVPNMQTAVIQQLTEKSLKIATAESCTGGLISKLLTDVPGASAAFDGGVCTYSNDMKEKLLGVSHETLAAYGAVSEQTAKEMADGVRKLFSADFGLATTGIAGPDGGTAEKPVGLVYVGVATGDSVQAHKLLLKRNYKNPRDFIREYASMHALSFILEALKAQA